MPAALPDQSAPFNLNLNSQFVCIYIRQVCEYNLYIYICMCVFAVQYLIQYLIGIRKCCLLLSLLLGSCFIELLKFGQRRNILGGSAAAHSACGN